MKRLFTLILVLFCFAEVKGQILWERIEKDTVTFLDMPLEVEVKDSLIFVYGIATWNTNSNYVWPTFFSSYNLNGRLKWNTRGRKIDGYRGFGFTIDSDSTLVNYGVIRSSGKFFFQKIKILNGDTLKANQYWAPITSAAWSNNSQIIKNTSGNYILGGSGCSFLELNKSGNILWEKNSFSTMNGNFSSLLQNKNGNYIYSGDKSVRYNSTNIYRTHPFLVELKPNGDTIKSKMIILKNINNHEQTHGWSEIIQDLKGNYLITGVADSTLNNNWFYFAAKIDSQFNLQWTYINTGVLKDYHIYRINELADSTFILLGESQKDHNYAIIRISAAGQYLAHKTYQNSFCNGTPDFFDWKVLLDGTIIVAGRCKNYGYKYLARVAGFGAPAVLGNSEEVENSDNYLTEAYPNPANETVMFTFSLPAKVKQAEIRVSEIATGKIVKQIPLSVSEKQQQTSLANLNSGMYAYTLLVDGIPVSTKKLVVVK